jgi:prepilin-type N-terminal cleavage/methylation domain-containing protein
MKQAGFSLIESLIVVAIILVIAAIAIPSFLSSRMAANEAAAVESLRTIQSSLTAYAITYPAIGYAAQLSDLGDGGMSPCVASTIRACMIDSILASGVRSGYAITYVQDPSSTPSVGYIINSDPVSRGATGRRSYFTNTPGVIRYNVTAPAAMTDPVL